MALPEVTTDAGAAAARLLATAIGNVERVPSFAGNRVFKASTGAGEIYLKFGAAEATAAEHAALSVAAQLGIPVPTVAAVDLDGKLTGSPCIATYQVDGQPMSGDEPLFSEVAPLLERLHRVEVNGFGQLALAEDGGLRGEDSSWLVTLQRRTHAARLAVGAGLVPGPLVDAVAAAVEAQPWGALEGSRLVHGDFHPRHVYADHGQITAIIDWGDATAGDPDYDIARILHSALLRSNLSSAIAIAAKAVPLSQRDMDPRRLRTLLTYAAVFILWSMHGELEGGAPWPPWWPIQTKALERVLDALATTL